jgi:phosphatidate cytidylyltransferase
MIIILVPFLLLGSYYYLGLALILGICSLWEILKEEKNISSYMKIISYVICALVILRRFDSTSYYNVVDYPMITMMFLIYSFSVIINKDIGKYNYKDGIWLFIITLIIGILFNGLIKVRMIGLYHLIYCLLISSMTDTFALFGGKLFGKHKLIPSISPNKTVEGSVIGSIFGTIIGSLFYIFVISDFNILIIVLLTLILTIFGQFGDLFFSSIKRYYKIKDFSNLIPGHGGLLDRLDSLLFVIAGYLVYILLIMEGL